MFKSVCKKDAVEALVLLGFNFGQSCFSCSSPTHQTIIQIAINERDDRVSFGYCVVLVY